MTEAASMQPANSCANYLAEKTPLHSACMAIRPAHHLEICVEKSAVRTKLQLRRKIINYFFWSTLKACFRAVTPLGTC